MISQLTVFLENEKGRLAGVCRALSDANINMNALFLADTEDFGVARIFCDTPEAAAGMLKAAGYRAALTPVLAIKVSNRPGGLAEILEFLDEHQVNVEYGYCFSVDKVFAIDVLKVSDPSIENELRAAGFEPVSPKDIYVID